MTPLKQHISLIGLPFSIEQTRIALTSDGILKISEIRRSVSC